MHKIVVLLGGNSPEREISLITGRNIAKQLTDNGYETVAIDPADYKNTNQLIDEIEKNSPDIIFNGLHGGDGENGKLQALFEMNGLKFTGSGSEACMFTMNKYVSKLIAADCEVPVPAHIYLHKGEKLSESELKKIGWPLIVKPNNAGSSVGISLVDSLEMLKPAMSDAFKYDDSILIEQYIPGRELTVTIIDNIARPVVEIKPKQGWYDYKNKYTSGNTEYIAPAELTEKEVALIQDYALRIFKRTGCKAYGRVDFRYDGDKFYFLEVNTLPGMTELSLTP
ncbi:MAG: D-alanine--D-alanine ligase, partial [Candidatus Cloacimonetes bacterium]|nr:D-alanine--D-alanine ligase [Candidatus Cloacimonadota bacterium]